MFIIKEHAFILVLLLSLAVSTIAHAQSDSNTFSEGFNIELYMSDAYPEMKLIDKDVISEWIIYLFKDNSGNKLSIWIGVHSSIDKAEKVFQDQKFGVSVFPKDCNLEIGDECAIWGEDGPVLFRTLNSDLYIKGDLNLLNIATTLDKGLKKELIKETEFRSTFLISGTEAEPIEITTPFKKRMDIQLTFATIDNLSFGTNIKEMGLGSAIVKKKGNEIMVEYFPANEIESEDEITFNLLVADLMNRLSEIPVHLVFEN